MTTGLTRAQAQIFNFIRDYIAKNSHPPSVREIVAGLRYASVGTVERGAIVRETGAHRSIGLLDGDELVLPPALVDRLSETASAVLMTPQKLAMEIIRGHFRDRDAKRSALVTQQSPPPTPAEVA